MKNFLILIPCLTLTACVYQQGTSQHHQGTSVSQQQVGLIQSGKTTKQWVLTNLGIPDRSQTERDGLEVFEYISDHTEKSNKTLLFVFNIDAEKEISHQVTRVVMRNDVVESVGASDL